MPTSSDRSEEWSILRTIYAPAQCDRAEHSDLPDFILTDGTTSQPWDVEVTEIFRSESEARTIHHQDYLAKLFDGGRHMHRDDKAALEVKMVLIRHEDGTQDRVPAVLTPEEPIQDRYERLANKIRHKATRPYRQNLRHLNLVIRDRCNTMGNKKERYSVSALMNSGVRDTLLAGPFREVYWITVIEGTGEQVYRPLRLLMIFEYFWIFCHGLKSWHTAPENLTPQDVVILFVDYCNRLHMDVQLLVENGKMWALNEGIAVSIDENGAQISDNRDFPHPGGQVQPRSTKLPELTDSQYASATEHFNATDFSTELYYTAEVPATLRHPAITAVKLRRVGDGNAEPPSSQ